MNQSDKAVSEPAKGEKCPKCGADRTYYDGWNCPTEGCDLPAKEPAAGELPPPVDPTVIIKRIRAKEAAAGVQAIATREWCVKSAEIEGEAEIGAGTPTGVEARVCELERKLAEARVALERIRDCEDAPDIDATGEWQTGLFCGVEDRDCRDRYEGAEYGHTVGVDKALEWATNEAREALARIDANQQKP